MEKIKDFFLQKNFKAFKKDVFLKLVGNLLFIINIDLNKHDKNLLRVNFAITPLFVNFGPLLGVITLKPGNNLDYFDPKLNWINPSKTPNLEEKLNLILNWFEENCSVQKLIEIEEANKITSHASTDWRYYMLLNFYLFLGDVKMYKFYVEKLKSLEIQRPFMLEWIDYLDNNQDALNSIFEKTIKINKEKFGF